jgi:hypothetical protein
LNGPDVLTLGQHYEDDQRDGPMTFPEAVTHCECLTLVPLDKAIVVDKAAGPLQLQHMPFRPMEGVKIKAFVDIVLDVDADFDRDGLVSLAQKGLTSSMPRPFNLKTPIGVKYIVQFVVLPNVDDETKVRF